MSAKIVYAGGPCTCHPGRYVRYYVPAVPGLEGRIHCRANDAAKDGLASHAIPAGAVLVLHAPSLRGR